MPEHDIIAWIAERKLPNRAWEWIPWIRREYPPFTSRLSGPDDPFIAKPAIISLLIRTKALSQKPISGIFVHNARKIGENRRKSSTTGVSDKFLPSVWLRLEERDIGIWFPG
jgi:hypothetical protein